VLGSMAVPIVIALTASLIAAITDIWKFKVYNLLTLPLLAAGVLYHGMHADLGNSLLGVLFGFGALIALHLVGGMGAGDVKLMAALGAWLGMPLTFYVFIASSLAAGVYAVVLMMVTGKVGETLLNLRVLWMRLASIGRYLGADDQVEKEVHRADRRRRIIPFAAMVLIGIIGTLLWFGNDLRP
jgi:prepilin peptidase CpaA